MIFGAAHFITDLMCHYYAFKLVPDRFDIGLVELLMLYNFLAFAMQCPIGYDLDGVRPHISAMIGYGGIALGYALGFGLGGNFIVIGFVLCGLGNAAIHSAGGVGVMELGKRGLVGSGLFVACGALGVGLGDWLGAGSELNFSWIFVLAAVAAVAAIWLNDGWQKKKLYDRNDGKISGAELLCLGFCLFAIIVRSYGGFLWPVPFMGVFDGVEEPLRGFLSSMFPNTFAFIGKASGAFLVLLFMVLSKQKDLRKANYMYGITALVLSDILIVGFGHVPVCFLLGTLLFHSLMPVTLYEIFCIFPHNPGFSLGISTLMLFLGLLPHYIYMPNEQVSRVLLAVIMGLAALSLFVAMMIYKKNVCTEKESETVGSDE